MRLHIDVQEGDWADVRYGSYGAGFSWTLDKLISSGEFDGAAGGGRWLELNRRTRRGTFEFSVPDSDMGVMTIGELTAHCLAEARRLDAARPDPSTVPNSGSPAWTADRIMDVWLSDSATDERLSTELTVGEVGLAEGDLLVLSIEHPAEGAYSMAAPRNPDELFRWLQLAENSTAPAGGPRLWGVLLYTDADVELATYVRTHFDDLNALSGPATRVFVVERRANWSSAKKYWRRHLEPELYRVMSTMHWLRWTPYDPQGAYEVAARLGLGPEQLPCLVFFRSPQGPRDNDRKIVFPIEHTSTAYFRSLFGAIDRAVRPVTDSVQSPEAEEDRRRLARYGPTSDYYRYSSAFRDTAEYAPAPDAVQNLLARSRDADADAFSAVREAERAIKSALRKLVPPAVGLAVNNSLVVVAGTEGAEVSENFYFQGENTTFINRPQDTVIRDFQNTYATTARADDLIQLLRLVLASRDMAAPDRDTAAGVIHDLARLGTAPEPDLPAARTRLERLRTLLASGADIAQPALAILASLTAFFSA
ncbi:hypothetical protein ACWD5V_15725 [Streptomyces sp. NPDC002523]